MAEWKNLVSMFYSQADRMGEKPFIWSKIDGSYKSLSWKEAAYQITTLSSSLKNLGIQSGDRVFLCAESRPEWIISNIAIMALGGITVPAYTTNTVEDHHHILSDSGSKIAIVSKSTLANRVITAANKTDTVETVIVMEPLEGEESGKIQMVNWADAMKPQSELSSNIDELISGISRDDTAVIIYTSGTGGAPKGVMLAHKSIIHNCVAARNLLTSFGLEDEVFLSFLPLSHSYEYTGGQFFPISIGAQVYFAEGVEQLRTNLTEAKPTLMTAVPRLYESMHARIVRGVDQAGGLKAKLFKLALTLGEKKLDENNKLTFIEKLLDSVVEKLVRKKVRNTFGGRLKALVSGGAPLNLDIGIFFSALGLRLLQGYGQTESAPIISANPPEKIKLHSVGPPVSNTEVKIADDGEILVRGDLVMQGYWRNETATKEAIKDGWLHTGDVGKIDSDGYIEITDRKKDIIVNSGGDNVSPQRVEGFLTLQPEIEQAIVYGDKRPHLVALLVPGVEHATDWAHKNGLSDNLSDLIENKEFIKTLDSAVARVNSELGVIEQVRRFALTSESFSVENEQMTPTLKVRRHIIGQIYKEKFESMYN